MITRATGFIDIRIHEDEQKRITLEYLRSLLPKGYDDLRIESGVLYGVHLERQHRRECLEEIRKATQRDILFLQTIKELRCG